ncbi:MAG: asparagine synthase C-terminal domain-containing protein, partial [Acidobacteriota bacterium]
RRYPDFDGEIDRGALTLYLRYLYIPAPYSIYEKIFKLPPGCCLKLRNDGSSRTARPSAYWSLREITERGMEQPFSGSEREAIEHLGSLLRSAVKMRMVADVPLGAFLSGGIDSSTVVALMQQESSRPVKTFTIGFREGTYDEASYARAVAARLGTDHTELYVTPKEAMQVIPELPSMYDEPFADSSQIPTFLLSHLARREVTVSLSGDGGDELLGGYNRYLLGMHLWRKRRLLPRSLGRLAGRLLAAPSPRNWNAMLRRLSLGRLPDPSRLDGHRVHTLAAFLSAETAEEFYHDMVSFWRDPSRAVVGGGGEGPTIFAQPCQWPRSAGFPLRMMFLDAVSYLPDDILTKVDRASMHVSLEVRVPFLDHRVVEFLATVPVSMKIRGGRGKWLLRQLLDRHVPRDLVDRPKSGFSVPVSDWLRGPLRDWAEALLDERRLLQEGYFHPPSVLEKWNDHLAERRDWPHQLWSFLMFQAWLEHSSQSRKSDSCGPCTTSALHSGTEG